MPSENSPSLLSQLEAAQAEIARLRACENVAFKDPSSASREIRKRFDISALEQEHFWAVLLDSHQKPLSIELIALGTVDSVVIHPREVFRAAVRMNAHSVVVVHNHPSGEVYPSSKDDELTARLRDGGDLLGIPVVDHLILTVRDTYSYAAFGRLVTLKSGE